MHQNFLYWSVAHCAVADAFAPTGTPARFSAYLQAMLQSGCSTFMPKLRTQRAGRQAGNPGHFVQYSLYLP